MTAITAVTVQNTMGVAGSQALSPRTVSDQIRAVATDIGVDAAKTGMLASAPIVEAVADAVTEMRIHHLVVDPVLVSKHGHALLAADAIEALKMRILHLAVLVTPNLSEASALAGVPVERREDMRRAADAILSLGAVAVLVKGGHLKRPTAASDLLVVGGIEEWVEAEWIDTPNTHGTGCTLSAAITSHLAMGRAWPTRSVQGRPSSPSRSVTHLRSGTGSDRWISCGRSGPERRVRGDRVAVYAARCGIRVTLPALMHDVQTCSRRGVPSTRARTFWMFGFQRRLLRLWGEGYRLAEKRLFPQPRIPQP